MLNQVLSKHLPASWQKLGVSSSQGQKRLEGGEIIRQRTRMGGESVSEDHFNEKTGV